MKLPKLTSDLLKRMDDRNGIIDSEAKYQIKSGIFLLCLWKHEMTRVSTDKSRDVQNKKGFIYVVGIVWTKILNEEILCLEYPKEYDNIETLDKARKATEQFFMSELNEDKARNHLEIVFLDDSKI